MAEILSFIPLGIIGSMTWSLWAVRRFYGTTYKPFQGAFTATTSVVVPVYMEDPEVLLQAIESYLENKVGDVIPGMSVDGVVNCLSGRTAAYRRSLLLPVLDELTGETFLGKTCVGGDDVRLTHLMLVLGYKTVYQSTARAQTVYSGGFSNFVRRKIRWSRNSYRANLRAFWQGWIWRKPWILPVSIFHATVTPYTFALGALATLYLALTHPGTQTTIFGVAFNFPLLWVILSISGRSIKGLSHLRQVPGDLSLLVIVTFLMLFVMFPVKLFSLVTMNSQGWVGTRQAPKLLTDQAFGVQ